LNLDALKEINTNNPEILEQSAKDNDSNPETVKGIALFVVKNGYDALTANQKYHFDKSIRPLIENVKCTGYTHEFDEMPSKCSTILNDDDLVKFYQPLGFYCERCQSDESAAAHDRENPFFKD
jgi:hypothetical protein